MLLKELYEQYCNNIGKILDYFNYCYVGDLYPSVDAWLEKVDKVNFNKVETYFKENNLPVMTSNYEFYMKYFYLMAKGETYYYEFADLALNDIKNLIKNKYEEVLTTDLFRRLIRTFANRYKYIDRTLLQEYSGKNRSRDTIKKEGSFVKDGEIYYLNPLIDNLWYEHGYDKLNEISLLGTRIINIRGTNGSGKTTMVKKIIETLNSVEEGVWDEFTTEEITTYHKVYTRKVQVWNKQKFVVMGIYNEKQTGGVDNYDTPWQVMYALFYFCKKYKGYTILFEGVRISTDYKYWWKMFTLLKSVGVEISIFGIVPSDIQWAVNNVIERRKGKGLWELRHPEDIANNNYDILRGLLLFYSQGFNPCIICPDKIGDADKCFGLLKDWINKRF